MPEDAPLSLIRALTGSNQPSHEQTQIVTHTLASLRRYFVVASATRARRDQVVQLKTLKRWAIRLQSDQELSEDQRLRANELLSTAVSNHLEPERVNLFRTDIKKIMYIYYWHQVIHRAALRYVGRSSAVDNLTWHDQLLLVSESLRDHHLPQIHQSP